MDTTPQPSASLPSAPKTSYGVIAGLLIIVAAIVIGALYFLQERVGSGIESSQNESTDPKDIEADLAAMSGEDFDREIDQAFLEVDAAIEEPQ
jgi:hypothetical protein